MRINVLVVCLSLASFSQVSQALTVEYSVEELDANLFRLSYEVGPADFGANQELAIDFDAAVFGSLSNGVAPQGFDLQLYQPNQLMGLPGRFSALALADLIVWSGAFRVDVTTVSGGTPEAQEFALNQLDEQGNIVSVVATGVTSAAIPEPATLALVGLALILGAFTRAVLRRLKRTA